MTTFLFYSTYVIWYKLFCFGIVLVLVNSLKIKGKNKMSETGFVGLTCDRCKKSNYDLYDISGIVNICDSFVPCKYDRGQRSDLCGSCWNDGYRLCHKCGSIHRDDMCVYCVVRSYPEHLRGEAIEREKAVRIHKEALEDCEQLRHDLLTSDGIVKYANGTEVDNRDGLALIAVESEMDLLNEEIVRLRGVTE